ncbi:hypothetical protein ASPWEDRAFT_262124 [Aspergillus wentii DTO 134E9]|uniref:Uncharacterized protein n=1 Tax=Aspergillus wentii DTO 134E9 TaxID=1073089 RepID=A0A1L9S2G8_ASPWE|nr:uncharacterized protein ASPWEDRAFT_262124 [Aspergillus wentii DTO 134E9]OJJ41349.1 hypothetical protein ASPWEDRAFT_262124 [Aspergillus wentii DTO 134E9]
MTGAQSKRKKEKKKKRKRNVTQPRIRSPRPIAKRPETNYFRRQLRKKQACQTYHHHLSHLISAMAAVVQSDTSSLLLLFSLFIYITINRELHGQYVGLDDLGFPMACDPRLVWTRGLEEWYPMLSLPVFNPCLCPMPILGLPSSLLVS